MPHERVTNRQSQHVSSTISVKKEGALSCLVAVLALWGGPLLVGAPLPTLSKTSRTN